MQPSLFAGLDLGPIAVPDAASNEWYTPRWVLDLLPSVALDPCYCAQSNVAALKAIDVRLGEDGLAADWGPRIDPRGMVVFCNPPYSNCSAWVEKCATEAELLSVPVVALVPAYSGDAYWHRAVWRRARFVGYFSSRLKFDVGPGVPAPSCASFTSCLVVWARSSMQAQACVEGIAARAGDRLYWVRADAPAVDVRKAEPKHGSVWACVSSGAHPSLGRVNCVRCGQRIEWANWFTRRCSHAA